MIRGKMIECKCAVCGEKFMARVEIYTNKQNKRITNE